MMLPDMTREERELLHERIEIMFAELDTTDLSFEQVESAMVNIQITARQQILDRRQRAIDASKAKKQTGFMFGGML